MKIRRRHKIVKSMVSPFIMPVLNRKFNLCIKKSELKPPFLVVANHASDFDAFFVSAAFGCPIYFVMSDHVSSIPVAGKLIEFFVRPLPITKSSLDVGTVREIISVVNQGGAVGIFPEGNKSFAGDMSFIKPSIAKLAKKLNVPLVIFNIIGGYFSQPRWGETKRKGRICAHVAKVIEPQELEKMNVKQIYKAIKTGLSVNAYDEQEKDLVHFSGKKLANGIESMLYACPECGAIGTIRSQGDRFWCSACGDSNKYLDTGYVQGNHFERLDEWDKWQKQHIFDLKIESKPNDEVLLHDAGWRVEQKRTKYKNKKLGIFETFLFSDRLLIANKKQRFEVGIDKVAGIAIEGACGLQLWLKTGEVFRLKNAAPVSALKYADFIWALQKKEFLF